MDAPSMFGGVIVFTGSDSGASAPGAGSTAAAALFDTAAGLIGPESIVDFELPLVATNSAISQTIALSTGVSVNGAAIDIRNVLVPSCGNSVVLCGGNTTSGGSQWLEVHGQTATFTFLAPIQYFGAYFGGLQGASDGQETITFDDGSAQTVDIPEVSGGYAFAGFTDAGASIYSVSVIFEIATNGDIVSVDDVRYGPASVPEPASAALMGIAVLFGFVARMRAKSL